MRKTPSILVFGTVLISTSLLEMIISAGIQEDNANVLILERLKRVSVQVVQPASGFEDRPKFNPVKLSDLHATVERLLSSSGIEVVGTPADDSETGHIIVIINVWRYRRSLNFILQVETRLYQHATLVRDEALQVFAPTWPLGEKALETAMPIIVTRGLIARTAQDEVETQVKKLITDYLEANPHLVPKPDISGMMTGTVKHSRTTIYVIIADNGVQYEPGNLPRHFKRHGLRIAFRARRTACTWRNTTVHLGTPIKIIKIIKL